MNNILFETLQQANEAFRSGQIANAAVSLKRAREIIECYDASDPTFCASMVIQAVILALQLNDPDLARDFAVLLLSKVSDYVGDLWQRHEDLLKKRDELQAENKLLEAVYTSVTFFPFIQLQSQIVGILNRSPSIQKIDEVVNMFNLVIRNFRPILDKKGWASWHYPRELERNARFWCARVLTDYSRLLLQLKASGKDVQDAHLLAETSLLLHKNHPPDQLTADIYNLLARIFLEYQEYDSFEEKALPFFEQSISILEGIGNQKDAAADRANLGALMYKMALYYRENEPAGNRASFYFFTAEKNLKTALEIQIKLGEPELSLRTLNFLAALYTESKDYQKALNLINNLVEVMNKTLHSEIKVEILANFGNLMRLMKNIEKAGEFFMQAIEIIEKKNLKNLDPKIYLIAYGGLGDVYRQQGQIEDAYHYLSKAIDKLKSFRSSFVSVRTSQGLLKGFRWIFESMIDCCFRLGVNNPDMRVQAFQIAEELKWRIFTDSLSLLELQPVDVSTEPLATAEKQLLQKLFDLKLGHVENAARLKEAELLQHKLEEIWTGWETRYPEYVSVRRGETIKADDVAGLLDDEVSFLVEYYLGDELDTALGFLVTKDEPIPYMFRLDKNPEQINNLVQELRAYVINDQKSSVSFNQVAAILHTTLVEPILSHIPEGMGVCIVPYGSLHNVPFSALYDGVKQQYWIERNPIVIAPSATALKWWVSKNKRQAQNCLIFTATEVKDSGLAPLTQFENVAEKFIKPLFKACNIIEPHQATKQRFLQEITESIRKAPWDVIHIACHGKYISANGFGSYLIMEGDPSDDKKNLTALEIFSQIRTNATLVTLSSCESGIALAATGDDIAGLAQSFLFSGASSVLSSLWLLNVNAGYIFFQKFYNFWLKQPLMSKIKAMQQAQIEVVHAKEYFGLSKPYTHPYYWAVFQLNGDWK